MNAYNKIEVSSGQISEIFFQCEKQIMNKIKKKYHISDIKDSSIRNKSAKITLSHIPLNSKNIYGIKLHQKLSKLKSNKLSDCITNDLFCKKD